MLDPPCQKDGGVLTATCRSEPTWGMTSQSRCGVAFKSKPQARDHCSSNSNRSISSRNSSRSNVVNGYTARAGNYSLKCVICFSERLSIRNVQRICCTNMLKSSHLVQISIQKGWLSTPIMCYPYCKMT